MPKGSLTENQLLEKASRYCAYQERSEADLRRRLKMWKADDEMADRIVSALKDENFFNDRRFAQSFTRGRFSLKKWGRIKIRYALLHQHGISADIIEECLCTIDEDAYLNVLRDLMNDRTRGFQNPDLQKKSKVFNYLRSKGYEYDLISLCWEEAFPNC